MTFKSRFPTRLPLWRRVLNGVLVVACDGVVAEDSEPQPAIGEQQSKCQCLDLFNQLSQPMAWKTAGMLKEAQFEKAKGALSP